MESIKTNNNMTGVMPNEKTSSSVALEDKCAAENNYAAIIGDADQLTDLISLIPEDESAVEENNVAVIENEDQCVDLTSLIPDDEIAEEPLTEGDDLSAARELNIFSEVRGMKMLTDGEGHIIYAEVRADTEGKRSIEFVQRYSDGTFSSRMRILQSDLLIASRYQFLADDVNEKSLKKKVAKFGMDVTEEYFSKIKFPQEQIDIIDLLNLLVDNYRDFPAIEETEQKNREELYKQLVENIKKIGAAYVDEHKCYYTVFEEQIVEIAANMDMTKLELLRKLKEYGFLYLPKSSKGYQTYVRFKKTIMDADTDKYHFEWCYCILKVEYLAKLKMKLLEQH